VALGDLVPEARNKKEDRHRSDRAQSAEQHEGIAPGQHDDQQRRRRRHGHFSDVAGEICRFRAP
jgi:hypothetical protein